MPDLDCLVLRVKARLSHKYNQSLVFFYTRDINRLVFPSPHDPLVLAFKEEVAFRDDRQSFILQFNDWEHLGYRLSFLLSFYRYHLHIPRTLHLKVLPIVSLFYAFTRKVTYRQVELLISQLVAQEQGTKPVQPRQEVQYESILADLHSQLHQSPLHTTSSNPPSSLQHRFQEFIQSLPQDNNNNNNNDTIKALHRLIEQTPNTHPTLKLSNTIKALPIKVSPNKPKVSKETRINKQLIEHIKRNQKRIQLNIRNNTQKYKSLAGSTSEECGSPLKKGGKCKTGMSIRMLEHLYRPKERTLPRSRIHPQMQSRQHLSDNLPNQSSHFSHFNSSLPFMRRKGRQESQLLDRYAAVMNKIQQRIKGSLSRDKRKHLQPK